MFKHLLLPTDGSAASEEMIHKCMQFASESGAQVTGLHVTPEFHFMTYRTGMLEGTPEQFKDDSEELAMKYLSVIDNAAREAGVPCTVTWTANDHPFEAIIQTASEHGCDLIVMASHGRKGMKGVLMGSETQKVLTHSRIPVLVYR